MLLLLLLLLLLFCPKVFNSQTDAKLLPGSHVFLVLFLLFVYVFPEYNILEDSHLRAFLIFLKFAVLRNIIREVWFPRKLMTRIRLFLIIEEIDCLSKVYIRNLYGSMVKDHEVEKKKTKKKNRPCKCLWTYEKISRKKMDKKEEKSILMNVNCVQCHIAV